MGIFKDFKQIVELYICFCFLFLQDFMIIDKCNCNITIVSSAYEYNLQFFRHRHSWDKNISRYKITILISSCIVRWSSYYLSSKPLPAVHSWYKLHTMFCCFLELCLAATIFVDQHINSYIDTGIIICRKEEISVVTFTV